MSAGAADRTHPDVEDEEGSRRKEGGVDANIAPNVNDLGAPQDELAGQGQRLEDVDWDSHDIEYSKQKAVRMTQSKVGLACKRTVMEIQQRKYRRVSFGNLCNLQM